MTHEQVIKESNKLTEPLKAILGHPNFICGSIAQRLRNKGIKCKPKAEEEQALVIHIMLAFYDKYGDKWDVEFSKYMSSNPVTKP